MVTESRIRRNIPPPSRRPRSITEQSFRDILILTAREARRSGYRQLVPLSTGDYTNYLREARELVASHDPHFSLREHLIFEKGAKIVLARIPGFERLQVFGTLFDSVDGRRLVELFIRPMRRW